jgi:hypothetical protein
MFLTGDGRKIFHAAGGPGMDCINQENKPSRLNYLAYSEWQASQCDFARPICFSRKTGMGDLKSVRAYYWIGYEYRAGATSLREVSRRLLTLQSAGRFPLEVAVGSTEIRDSATAATLFFGYEHFGLGERAYLFMRRGNRNSFPTLTPFGWRVWALTFPTACFFGDMQESR